MKINITIALLFLGLNTHAQDLNLVFEINQNHLVEDSSQRNGRLFIIFSKKEPVSVFNGIQYPDLNMNPVFGVDVSDWRTDISLRIQGNELYGFPIKNITELPIGNWYAYALFEGNITSMPSKKEEQIYSEPILIKVNSTAKQQHFQLSLDKKVNNIKLPDDKKHFKFETISSRLLTDFWKKPKSVAFQVALPKSYYSNFKRKYPLLIMIGGFGERYYDQIISEKELFASSTPEMIIVLLDSKAPFGDSYQINSANNGPYGDVLIEEIIPYIESNYHCVGDSTSRFLTGTSTGGWASLALQVFYPDFFNGVWSTCSDPVDFSQMELINIYKDENAFINRHGMERPAMRDINGEPRYTLRTEVWAENVLGMDNSYYSSGGQWGSWNAVFSPKDTITGFPKRIFDAETGKIDKQVAQAWKKYDLRLYLSENWESIGQKLQGKLHVWMGTMDSYYLNNAMVLLDRYLKSTANPKSDAEVNFLCGEGHACDSQIPLELMMQQMLERMAETKANE